MAVFLPRNPINDRQLISQVIASVIMDIIEEDESASYGEKSAAKTQIKSSSIEHIYNIYQGIATGELIGDSYGGSLIKKSVHLSYGAGIMGLSSNAKKQLAYDIQRELKIL